MSATTQFVIARLTALWNAHIPKCAVKVEHMPDHVRYLHPTKGWRRVSNKRLGLA